MSRREVSQRHDPPRPVYWPDLRAEEANGEWDDLRVWVAQLRTRFPNVVRLPDCWWRHNDLVEVLAALRDYERASFAPASSATAPVEWHRALRDMEMRIEIWIKRFTCSVPGRGHAPPDCGDVVPPGWQEFIDADVDRRRESPACDPHEEGRSEEL
jgi:hypothetical protein